jgi:lipopolysaccharide/colanic/teichoic acid biosynthesis glycosyltransferase
MPKDSSVPKQVPFQNGRKLEDENGLHSKEHFDRLLCAERKRSARSKRPFLLMLLDVKNIAEADRPSNFFRDIAALLIGATREIDIKGWVKCNSVVGVIFIEMNVRDIGSAIESIERKIANKFQQVLPPEILRKIEITFRVFPEDRDTHKSRTLFDAIFYPDIPEEGSAKKGRFVKRMIDIAGSILGCIFFSPFFILIPLLIKATSRGPVFFKQERIGRFGKKFTFLKFRSMVADNDPKIHQEYIGRLIKGKDQPDKKGEGGSGSVYKIKEDPRVTPIGRILRKLSLDELPQLINVLKGEMSLVGPRPPIPYEYEEYDIWHRRRLLDMNPGVTGLWQVKGRSSTNFDGMVRLDIQYINEWSLWLDFKILLLTPRAVLTCKGAY